MKPISFFCILFVLLLPSCSKGGGGGNDFVPSDSDPLPLINSVTPNQGPVTGGTRVTVLGANFFAPVSVTLGGSSVLNLLVNSTSSLSFTVPAGPAGFAEIVVTGSTGSSSSAVPLGFTRLSETWRTISSSGATPAGRSFGKMLYDPNRQRMLLFGGESFNSTTFETIFFGDVWALDLSSPTMTAASWIPLSPNVGTSGIGSFAEMAVVYDSTRDRFLLTQGYDNCPPFPDPCINIGATVYALSFSSNSVNDSGTWTRLTDIGVDFPADRLTPGSAYDPINNRLVLFGGFDPISFTGSNGAGEFSDTWAFNLVDNTSGFWEELTATTGTVPVGGADPASAALTNPSLIFDAVQGRLVMFGGFEDIDPAFGVGENVINRTYQFSATPTTGPWSFFPLGSGTLPPPSNGQSGFFDPVNERMIVHGGFAGFGQDPLDETWALDLSRSNGSWVLLSIGPDRENHMIAYDALFGRAVLFGGSSVTAGDIAETWVFELNN